MAATDVETALFRPIDLARSDTGQSRRAANFLLAWWNGDDWGHFQFADLFAVDRAVACDMATIFSFLADYPGAIYADAFGARAEMDALVALRRPEQAAA